MRRTRLGFALFLALVTFAAARPAKAIGPVDIEVAAKSNYASDNLAYGLGGRLGVSIFGIYGGLSLIDYFGWDDNYPRIVTFGGEVGYGFKPLKFLTIRPLVGFGSGFTNSQGALIGTNLGDSSSPYVEPGGLVQFAIGPLLLGIESSALLFTSSYGAVTPGCMKANCPTVSIGWPSAWVLGGQVGIKL